MEEVCHDNGEPLVLLANDVFDGDAATDCISSESACTKTQVEKGDEESSHNIFELNVSTPARIHSRVLDLAPSDAGQVERDDEERDAGRPRPSRSDSSGHEIG